MTPDIITTLYIYFAKFVDKSVLSQSLCQTSRNQENGYSEIVAEIVNTNDQYIVPEIRTFVFSSDIERVSDKIKNSSGVILFVETGEITFDPSIESGTEISISLTVAKECQFSNNDNLNEQLIINQTNNILMQILKQMKSDQDSGEYCCWGTVINFPAKITPVERSLFFNRAGWSAEFTKSQNI